MYSHFVPYIVLYSTEEDHIPNGTAHKSPAYFDITMPAYAVAS